MSRNRNLGANTFGYGCIKTPLTESMATLDELPPEIRAAIYYFPMRIAPVAVANRLKYFGKHDTLDWLQSLKGELEDKLREEAAEACGR